MYGRADKEFLERVNYLIIESLQKFHHYLGDDFKVECPTGSAVMMTLKEVATELSQRLCQIFLLNKSGLRPVYGGKSKFQTDPHWRDLILFYEYFHGDNGAGIGASHQTGWQDGWCVIRFDPSGREMMRVQMPVQRPTSCMFGNPDLTTLYITTASVGLSEAEIQA